MKRNNSYKGFEFRFIVVRQGNEPDKGVRPAKHSMIKEWLIIRNDKILDRARLVCTAKARIDSGLYNKKP